MSFWIDQQIARHCDKPFHAEIFVPQSTFVVLGSSNQADVEVCSDANIEIFRRAGGGGTVVLYPGCVVVSLGMWVEHPFQNAFYFREINQALIRAIQEASSSDFEFSQDGISDIVYQDRKFVGTSLFRSRNYLMYQASILVELNHDLIARVLQHPSREPDYRKGRNHQDFLLGLQQILPSCSAQILCENLGSSNFESLLQPILRSVDRDQVPHLKKRFSLDF